MQKANISNVFAVSVLGMCVLGSGCQGGGANQFSGPVLPPLPKEHAVNMVNTNISRLNGALRATGSVDGHFISSESRRRVRYNVDGTLFFMSPHYIRFDLKKLGDRQALFGSNSEYYWVYTKDDNRYTCGRVDDPGRTDLPLHPTHIVEALGLSPIPAAGAGVQTRVMGEYQQIIFSGREYWLDRRAPRLVRKVVFRNPDGTVAMSSDLSDYRPVPGGGMLPHMVDAQWPARNARLRFDVGRWVATSDVTPDGPQFGTPAQCRQHTARASYSGR